jgi:ADP-ribose pyrophosphatase YjhB (NUDIX family)
MKTSISCPHCGGVVTLYRNPIPTTDIIISIDNAIALIKRKNPPEGWALPGGFIDYGETAEAAAKREALEETSLDITDLKLFGVYSDPERDPRHHTLTVVFTARANGQPKASDDAADVGLFSQGKLPSLIAFDHAKIIDDFFAAKKAGAESK